MAAARMACAPPPPPPSRRAAASRGAWLGGALCLLALASRRALPPPAPPPPPPPPVCLDWWAEARCTPWRVCNASNRTAPRRAAACAASPRALEGHDASRHVLVVHEQHPQPLGCDRRLLALVALLQEQGREVSLLYRRDVPAAEQAPPTPQLAARLGVVPFDAAEVGGCLRAPPALYRFGGARQLERLAQRGWFGLVLVTVWFWNDPSPSFAEVALPLLRAHAAPPPRAPHRPAAAAQPFVALLVDDAHAVRAARLAAWESDAAVRAAYVLQAARLPRRLASLYRMADLVAHVSAEDAAAERAAFPFVARWQLLRTPLRTMRVMEAEASAPRRVFAQTRHVGFLGNGQTATNHQAIQWFLTHCWPALRAAQPELRLRLVGRLPGAVANASGTFDCTRGGGGAGRCGWAWNTSYAGAEAAHGVDELGFLSSAALVDELLSWRLMVAPIRATTGINTKLLAALELGIPLVVSAAAAAPLGLRAHNRSARDGGVVAVADSAEEIVRATLRLYTNPAEWKRMAAAVRHEFHEMLQADPSADDVRQLLAAACAAHFAPETPLQREQALAAPDKEWEGGMAGWRGLLPATAGERRPNRSHSPCFRAAPPPAAPPATLLLVASRHPLAPYAAATLHRTVWRLCQSCALQCFEHPQHLAELGALPAATLSLHRPPTHTRDYRAVRADADVWMDAQWAPHAAAFAALDGRYKLLRFAHDLAAPREGGAVEGVGGGVAEALELPLPLRSCGHHGALPRGVAAAVEAMGGVEQVWRTAFSFFGLDPWAVDVAVRYAREESERTYTTVCAQHRAKTNLEWLNGEGEV